MRCDKGDLRRIRKVVKNRLMRFALDLNYIKLPETRNFNSPHCIPRHGAMHRATTMNCRFQGRRNPENRSEFCQTSRECSRVCGRCLNPAEGEVMACEARKARLCAPARIDGMLTHCTVFRCSGGAAMGDLNDKGLCAILCQIEAKT